jgi:hypothetical protein
MQLLPRLPLHCCRELPALKQECQTLLSCKQVGAAGQHWLLQVCAACAATSADKLWLWTLYLQNGTSPLACSGPMIACAHAITPIAVVTATLLLLQELVDSARRLLDANNSQLQHLCSRAGFTPPDDQGVHDAYSRAVREWEGQVLAKRAGERSCSACFAAKQSG